MLPNTHKIFSLKYLLLALISYFFLVGFFTNAAIIIPDSISSALQVIQRILVTSDGNDTGTPIMDINSGGNVVVYAPLKNSLGESFLTSESDPSFSASVAAGIISNQIYHWDDAYSRWDHRLMGYLTGEADPLWTAVSGNYYSKLDVDNLLAGLAGGLLYKWAWDYSTGNLPEDISLGDLYTTLLAGDFNGLVLQAGDMIIANTNLSGVSATGDRDVIRNVQNPETDPFFLASVASGITVEQISFWDDAYARGNHADAGYLTGEADPIRNIEKANYYTIQDINEKGYLTWYIESDPVWNAEKNNYYTTGEIDAKGYLTNYVETDPTWLSDKSNYYTNLQIDSLLSGYLTTGAVGATWATWPQWPQGLPWNDGAKWETWAIGPQWPAWADGVTWTQWIQGEQGIQGVTWATPNHERSWTFLRFEDMFGWRWSFVDLKWEKWDQWDIWPQGTTWATWPQGDIWPQWPAWADGAKWETGATGPQWPQGIQGATWTFDGTESDPLFVASASSGISSTQVSHRDDAYGRGNHSGLYAGMTLNNLGTTVINATLNLRAGTTGAGTAPLKFTDGPLLTASEIGAMEFYWDALYFSITSPKSTASQYPPVQNGVYVKSTTFWSAGYETYRATDPTKSLVGGYLNNQRLAKNGTTTNQRFHIDLGSEKVIDKIYYENSHNNGASTNQGVKNFTFWGSNSPTAFADLTYWNDADWTQITTSQGVFDQHVWSNIPDPKYITVTNTTPYRYYAFKFADNWGGTYFGVRRIELQTQGGDYRRNVILSEPTNLSYTRIPFTTINWRLTDSNLLTFDETTLMAPALSATTGKVTNFTTTNLSVATSATAPKVIWWIATTSTLSLQPTAWVWTTWADIKFLVGNNGATEVMRILNNGNIGIGTITPTARLHLSAGTTAAGTAPLKFTSGPLLTNSEAGTIEFLGDDYYATISAGGAGQSLYPPLHNTTYVKATSYYSSSYYPHFTTDPTKPLIWLITNNQWLSANGVSTNQRFHIDLGSEQVINKIYYENEHSQSSYTDRWVKDFTFWGSNSPTAFADLVYWNDADWTQLVTSQSIFNQHVAVDVSDPQYITVTNTTWYRYYAFKFANNWGNASHMGVRRIELQDTNIIPGRKNIVLTNNWNLTLGRIPYATTNGRLMDGIGLTFDGTNFAVGADIFFVDGTLRRLGIGTIVPSSTLDVVWDIELPSTWSVLLWPPDTEGTWKITTSGGSLSFQLYTGSAWIEKSIIAQ